MFRLLCTSHFEQLSLNFYSYNFTEWKVINWQGSVRDAVWSKAGSGNDAYSAPFELKSQPLPIPRPRNVTRVSLASGVHFGVFKFNDWQYFVKLILILGKNGWTSYLSFDVHIVDFKS